MPDPTRQYIRHTLLMVLLSLLDRQHLDFVSLALLDSVDMRLGLHLTRLSFEDACAPSGCHFTRADQECLAPAASGSLNQLQIGQDRGTTELSFGYNVTDTRFMQLMAWLKDHNLMSFVCIYCLSFSAGNHEHKSPFHRSWLSGRTAELETTCFLGLCASIPSRASSVRR